MPVGGLGYRSEQFVQQCLDLGEVDTLALGASWLPGNAVQGFVKPQGQHVVIFLITLGHCDTVLHRQSLFTAVETVDQTLELGFGEGQGGGGVVHQGFR